MKTVSSSFYKCTPKWSRCTGSDLTPCPFCGTLCLNPPIAPANTTKQCENPYCNCCLKSSVSEPVVDSGNCLCCRTQVASENKYFFPTEYYRCPWCTGGIMIHRSEVPKYENNVYQQHSGNDQRMMNQKNCCFCPCCTRVQSSVLINPNATTITNNMRTHCPNCSNCPCNMHKNHAEMQPKVHQNIVTQKPIDKVVECKPKRSFVLIGGKMVSCGCARRNGLQDECVI
ncbi:uncharacterized protein LOC123313668 [Coccinella septempunctata]|uniref:uncharacterized protein LOC123313668 n=1 Tax=Coccinella septempunctata TaxID=41139 RepID=UPI001D07EA4B|nr:uncharacterized protein LOC123313668 [Coccinella septempunctata]